MNSSIRYLMIVSLGAGLAASTAIAQSDEHHQDEKAAEKHSQANQSDNHPNVADDEFQDWMDDSDRQPPGRRPRRFDRPGRRRGERDNFRPFQRRQRGRPGFGPPPGGASPREIVQFLEAHYPDEKMVKRARQIFSSHSPRAQRAAHGLMRVVGEWARAYENPKDRPIVEIQMRSHADELKLRRLRVSYLASDDEQRRKDIASDIRELCGRMFDTEIEQKTLRLERQEQRIAELRERLKQQKNRKEEWIERRLDKLTAEDDFEWFNLFGRDRPNRGRREFREPDSEMEPAGRQDDGDRPPPPS